MSNKIDVTKPEDEVTGEEATEEIGPDAPDTSYIMGRQFDVTSSSLFDI